MTRITRVNIKIALREHEVYASTTQRRIQGYLMGGRGGGSIGNSSDLFLRRMKKFKQFQVTFFLIGNGKFFFSSKRYF